jgi:hypothetical protein
MAVYKFSVGKVKLNENGVLVKEILPLRDVEFRYDVTTVRKIGADGVPLDEFKQEERLIVTLSYAANSYELATFKDKELDLSFEAGAQGHGILVTIANCKLIGYTLRQTSATYAIAQLTFSKRGEIGGAPLGLGEEPTKQTIKFGSDGDGWVDIGDSAHLLTAYIGNAQSLIIPTALGVLTRTTEEMGGGQLNITVRGYVKKDTRLELEQYLINLYAALATDVQKLKVEYGATSYTIDDVCFVSGRPDVGLNNYSDFTLEFMKSAY